MTEPIFCEVAADRDREGLGGRKGDGGSVTATRALLFSFATLGVDLRAGRVTASHLRVNSSDTAMSAGVGGVRAASGTALTLFDFYFFRADPCVLTLDAGVAYAAVRGVIDDARNAYCIPAGAYGPDDLYSQVTLIGVPNVIRSTDES